MLPTNLTTNEVKNSAGTEVEFLYLSKAGRTMEYAQSGETPNLEHRIKISHLEVGSSTKQRRRSLLRVDKTIAGVDGSPVTISGYVVLDIPIGNISNLTDTKHVAAEVMSLFASLGASTTILYDCTGYGADALVNGSL
jgi:hypothetical protein